MKTFLVQHVLAIVAIAIAFVAGSIFVACAAKSTKSGVPAPLPAGAVDSFDAWTFQQLSELKAGIDQAKTEYTAGNLPFQSVKVIDQAAGAFNLTEGLAARYHDSGGKGTDAVALQAEITTDVAQIAGYIAALRGTAAANKTKIVPAPAK